MSLLDTIRRSLGSEPLPPAAIDVAIDACEMARAGVRPSAPAASSARPPPLPRRLPSAAAPIPTRHDSDSTPTPSRLESDSQPAPSRKRAGGKPKARKKASRSVKGLCRQEIVVAERADARGHAAALLDYLFESVGCRPGDRIMARQMQTTYWHHLCWERQWMSLPWGGANGVGRHLRELCGGKKEHRDIACAGRDWPDGRRESPVVKTRVYTLPAHWPDERGRGARGETVMPFPTGARKRRAAAPPPPGRAA